MTVGQAVDSIMNNNSPTAEGTGSGKIAKDLTGGLLGTSPLTSVDSSGNRVRNDDALGERGSSYSPVTGARRRKTTERIAWQLLTTL